MIRAESDRDLATFLGITTDQLEKLRYGAELTVLQAADIVARREAHLKAATLLTSSPTGPRTPKYVPAREETPDDLDAAAATKGAPVSELIPLTEAEDGTTAPIAVKGVATHHPDGRPGESLPSPDSWVME